MPGRKFRVSPGEDDGSHCGLISPGCGFVDTKRDRSARAQSPPMNMSGRPMHHDTKPLVFIMKMGFELYV